MLATAVALLIYLVALAPLIWLPRPDLIARRPLAIYGAAILAIVIFQTGVISRGSMSSTDVKHLISSDPTGDQCERVLEVLNEANVVLELAQGRLFVSGQLWQQLPEEVREVVVGCSARLIRGEVDATELEVIER